MGQWRSVVAVAMTAAVVTGCSSSASEEPADAAPSTETKSEQSTGSNDSSQVKGGVTTPDSLTDFQCAPDDNGRWSVSGTLTNEEDGDADFRVTVVVAPPGTPSATAREITVPDVRSGKSADFTSKRLPATSGEDPVCSVQVVRLH